MRKRILITGCCFRAPGLRGFDEIIEAMDNPGFCAAFGEMALSDERKTFAARLDLDKASPHYPSGSSLKVLRSDVIAALICSGELLEQAGLAATERLDVPLYISNGSGFDLSIEQLTEITTAYLPQARDESLSSRYQRINAALPPMYVLRTLANATECFVAQKTGAKGNNATFGLSSHSTHYALLEGMRRIENNEAEMALVGASNGIGVFSALIVGNYNQAGFEWRESEGAGILLLESGESASRSGRRPLAEIVSIHSGKGIPDIFSDRHDALPYQDFNHDLAEYCLFSGGFSRDDHRLEEKACKGKWQATFSWFNQLGITGNNAILLNVATAIALFKKGRADQVDCLNRDMFGRESFLKLMAVES